MTHFAFRRLRYKTQVDRRIAPDNSLLGNGGILRQGSNNQIHLIYIFVDKAKLRAENSSE